jgi:hypothetical protein
MKFQQAPLAELEQPCPFCFHQNAGHTGGAKNWGWAIYDEVWANALGWCETPGCECGSRRQAVTRVREDVTAARDDGLAPVEVGDSAERTFAPAVQLRATGNSAIARLETSPSDRTGFPVWHCPREHANDLLRAKCRTCGAHRPCGQWLSALGRHCGDTPVHMFPAGPLCEKHEP